ncbi:MAG: glycosyltransferase family 4 protein, partial [Chloroflexota bacterium]
MRLLILARSTLEHPQKGGMEVHAAQVASGLAARGHTVEVLTTSHPGGVIDRVIDGVPHHFLPGTKSGAYSPEGWAMSRAWTTARHARVPYDAMLA